MSEAISIENPKVPASEVFAKEGYKKTKLGWIPEEWSVKSLGEIGVFSKGKGISKSEITETGLPCVRYAEIYTKYNNYVYCFNSFINRNSAQNSKTIESGDILFAGSGETLEDIGKCIAYLGKETVYAGGDIIVLKPKTENSKYLSFALNHSIANKQKHKLGQGHSVVHIYSSSLKNLKIILPPLPEQQKIAAILSTWDNAISKQEQLIAAKQHYKKGLMQLLLTGKKRFDGFDEGWEEVRLRDLAKITMGQSPDSVSYNDKKVGLWLIQGNADIKQRKSRPRFWTSQSTKICEIGEILMTVRAPVGAVAKSEHKACIGRGVCSIKPNESNDFIYYKLLNFEKKWSKYEQGSTFSAVSSSDIKNLKINIPNSIKEQQEISQVLTDADIEIALIQNQLTQLQTQKRGLMQKLLTGALRVKI